MPYANLTTDGARILVVDDAPDAIHLIDGLLSPHYHVHVACNGTSALGILAGPLPIDLILLDVLMPDLDGFEVCRRLRALPGRSEVPVVFLTGSRDATDEATGFAAGANDFVSKPVSAPVLLARVATHLRLRAASAALREQNRTLEARVVARTQELTQLAAELAERNVELDRVRDAIFLAFCSLAEARDNETGNHLLRTQHYVRALAVCLSTHPRHAAELDDTAIELIFKSAPLHDIGKVGIPDAILLKPGPLTAAETARMHEHPAIGRDAILMAEKLLGAPLPFLRHAREIAYSHHERWDGRGYPEGLAGDAIPLSARLMALADVYDALISRRVYKPPMPHAQAVTLILQERGTRFDPDVTDAFAANPDAFAGIAARFRDE